MIGFPLISCSPAHQHHHEVNHEESCCWWEWVSFSTLHTGGGNSKHWYFFLTTSLIVANDEEGTDWLSTGTRLMMDWGAPSFIYVYLLFTHQRSSRIQNKFISKNGDKVEKKCYKVYCDWKEMKERKMSWESPKAFSDDPQPSKHLGTSKTQYTRESPRTKKLILHRISWWREVNEGRRLPRLVYNLFFYSTARVSCIVSPPSISSHRSSCLPPVLRTLYDTWPPLDTCCCSPFAFRWLFRSRGSWLRVQFVSSFWPHPIRRPKTCSTVVGSDLPYAYPLLHLSTSTRVVDGREVRNKCLIPVRFTIQLYLRYSDLLSTDSAAAAVYFFLTVVIVVVVVLLRLRGQFRTPRRRDLRLMSLLLRQRKETNDLIRRPF